jgi:hypothetical protein
MGSFSGTSDARLQARRGDWGVVSDAALGVVDNSVIGAGRQGASRALSSARAQRHLGVLGNFREVQSELFTDYPTTPHYHIYAVTAASVLVELAGAP